MDIAIKFQPKKKMKHEIFIIFYMVTNYLLKMEEKEVT